MPTPEQIQELIDNTYCNMVRIQGEKPGERYECVKFESSKNSNFIIIPRCGLIDCRVYINYFCIYLWSNSKINTIGGSAKMLYEKHLDSTHIYRGLNVRAVKEK